MSRIILTPGELALVVGVFCAITSYIAMAATAYYYARKNQQQLHELVQLCRTELDDERPFIDYAARYGLTGDPE